jgi:hypothetical protein
MRRITSTSCRACSIVTILNVTVFPLMVFPRFSWNPLGLFFPPCQRRFLRSLAPLLCTHPCRACFPALQTALTPKHNCCRVFAWIRLWLVRLVASGLSDVMHDPESEYGRVRGFRIASFLFHVWHYAHYHLQLEERSRIQQGTMPMIFIRPDTGEEKEFRPESYVVDNTTMHGRASTHVHFFRAADGERIDKQQDGNFSTKWGVAWIPKSTHS